jgi:hypothetical protein
MSLIGIVTKIREGILCGVGVWGSVGLFKCVFELFINLENVFNSCLL